METLHLPLINNLVAKLFGVIFLEQSRRHLFLIPFLSPPRLPPPIRSTYIPCGAARPFLEEATSENPPIVITADTSGVAAFPSDAQYRPVLPSPRFPRAGGEFWGSTSLRDRTL